MPKRFSIAIMMAWMTLFALAFSVLKGVDAPPQFFGIITILMLGIGFAQMWLFGGKKPRLASVVAGAVVLSCRGCRPEYRHRLLHRQRSSILLRIIYLDLLLVPVFPWAHFSVTCWRSDRWNRADARTIWRTGRPANRRRRPNRTRVSNGK